MRKDHRAVHLSARREVDRNRRSDPRAGVGHSTRMSRLSTATCLRRSTARSFAPDAVDLGGLSRQRSERCGEQPSRRGKHEGAAVQHGIGSSRIRSQSILRIPSGPRARAQPTEFERALTVWHTLCFERMAASWPRSISPRSGGSFHACRRSARGSAYGATATRASKRRS
jgi:hypothetical protein